MDSQVSRTLLHVTLFGSIAAGQPLGNPCWETVGHLKILSVIRVEFRKSVLMTVNYSDLDFIFVFVRALFIQVSNVGASCHTGICCTSMCYSKGKSELTCSLALPCQTNRLRAALTGLGSFCASTSRDIKTTFLPRLSAWRLNKGTAITDMI